MVKLVGVTGDVVLESGEFHLSTLITAAGAAGSGDHNPGQKGRPRGGGALMGVDITLRASSGAVGDIVSAIVIVTA